MTRQQKRLGWQPWHRGGSGRPPLEHRDAALQDKIKRLQAKIAKHERWIDRYQAEIYELC